MNIFNNLQEQYDQLWKYIIRPTRNTYPQKSLGPEVFELQGKKVKRVQFQLINPRGYVIYCSHFIPLQEQKYPCVIYMHGNSSNRTEGMQYLGNLIRKNISLCTFDFSGCGNSQGQYVSLGYYEQQDLNEVFEYIRHRPQVTSLAIWGRSMGAVTGLLYAKRSPNLCAAVFDSPFKSLKSLTQDLCKKNSKIPALIVAGALKIIAKTIQDKAKFDIYKLNPLKNEVPYLHTPAFFIVGMQDDMIPPEHTVTLFERYQGKKKYLQKVKGNHNDSRPEECVEKVIKFLSKHLKRQETQKSQKAIKQIQSLNIQMKKEIKEVQQFDFFDEENQIEDSSKQNQTVDFFAEDTTTQNGQQSMGLQGLSFSEQIRVQKVTNNESFSLTSMLSNVFSAVSITKTSQIKRGTDGYEKTIERISRQIFIDDTANYKKAKSSAQNYQQNLIQEVRSCKNQTFQKQIMENLDSWGF